MEWQRQISASASYYYCGGSNKVSGLYGAAPSGELRRHEPHDETNSANVMSCVGLSCVGTGRTTKVPPNAKSTVVSAPRLHVDYSRPLTSSDTRNEADCRNERAADLCVAPPAVHEQRG